jgi:hypothetical protein
MHTPAYSLNTLFAQMGLESSDEAIDLFIRSHGSISRESPLSEARCWTPSQSALLKEALADDSDWTEVVDQLHALLQKNIKPISLT